MTDTQSFRNMGVAAREIHSALAQLGNLGGLTTGTASALHEVESMSAQSANRVIQEVEAAKEDLAVLRGLAKEGVAAALVDRLDARLTDIMVAQEFQDLTGQMLHKVIASLQAAETQLLQMLLAVKGNEGALKASLDQGEADSVLAELGF